MDKKKKDEILRRAQVVFFKAILAGYASKGKKKDPRFTTKTSMFGFKKTNTRHYGKFTVIDSWTVSDHSNISFGTTTILFEEIPIWFMTYSGSYPENVIPFLKEALSKQYKTGEFKGGRGPGSFKSEDLVYINSTPGFIGTTNFSCFCGRERICVLKTGEELGFHEYSGMSMI